MVASRVLPTLPYCRTDDRLATLGGWNPKIHFDHRRRFSREIIRHAVRLYLRICLSYRDVGDLLSERGINVSYETVRRWRIRFGPVCANRCQWPRSRVDLEPPPTL